MVGRQQKEKRIHPKTDAIRALDAGTPDAVMEWAIDDGEIENPAAKVCVALTLKAAIAELLRLIELSKTGRINSDESRIVSANCRVVWKSLEMLGLGKLPDEEAAMMNEFLDKMAGKKNRKASGEE